ncbi:MAG TPA: ABC transporter ATP-binding protein [Xanthobacteraceae bacterium]|nr:ABC transporter ATP-binding protein [Xanthobacteraceae bacterium]
MLEIRNVDLFYGDAQALDQVSLEVGEGEVVAIVGANGAGKSSLIRTIFGMHRPACGEIRFEGRNIVGEPPHRICNLGIGQVAEGRQIFPSMTVGENLEMGAVVPRARRGAAAARAHILDLFPRLRERLRQRAGTLSGGEQQMLAIARCLMGRPRLVMLDEPSLGLAPIVVEDVFAAVRELNARDRLTIMLVEQNVVQSLGLADRGYVLENGRIVMSGSGEQLLADDGVRRAYVGI